MGTFTRASDGTPVADVMVGLAEPHVVEGSMPISWVLPFAELILRLPRDNPRLSSAFLTRVCTVQAPTWGAYINSAVVLTPPRLLPSSTSSYSREIINHVILPPS